MGPGFLNLEFATELQYRSFVVVLLRQNLRLVELYWLRCVGINR